MFHDLHFGGADFQVAGDAALYWPKNHLLMVADLHLEKASSYALSGQMLPPYDSVATLKALAELVRFTGAQAILSLGDNFHDDGGEARLSGEAADLLSQMVGSYDWTWITGNHDPGLEAHWGGEACAEVNLDSIMFRHEAEPAWTGPEISGHFHPKLRMNINKRHMSRRCFAMSNHKIIMPAFGAFTGGMDVSEAALIAQPSLSETGEAHALLSLPKKLTRFPLELRWQKQSG